MAGAFHVRCQGCDYEDEVPASRDFAYRLAEQPDVYLWTQFAWCPQCGRVIEAEELLSPSEAEHRIATTTGRIRRDAQRYRDMRGARQSPARCLTCGSVDIQPASWRGGKEAEWTVPHPPCGGEILIAGKIYFRGPPETAVYTPEGEFLERVPGGLLPGRGYY